MEIWFLEPSDWKPYIWSSLDSISIVESTVKTELVGVLFKSNEAELLRNLVKIYILKGKVVSFKNVLFAT